MHAVIFDYYSYDEPTEPWLTGSWGSYLTPEITVTEEELKAIQIFFECSEENYKTGVFGMTENKTDSYVKKHPELVAKYCEDEYIFEDFEETLMNSLPQAYWDYAGFSEVNPNGQECGGVKGYRIIKQ